MTLPSPETDLAPRLTVAQMVAAWRDAEADIRAAFALLAVAQTRLGDVFGRHPGDTLPIVGKWHLQPDYNSPEESLEKLSRTVWERLVDKVQVRQMMSVAAAKELDRQLERDELPPITEEAVHTMLAGFRAQAPNMLQAAVEEVFDRLRPRGNRYKSNSEYEVPPKVVLEWMVEKHYNGKLRVRYDSQQHLIALENVLHSLAGKGSVCKGHHSDLSHAIDQSPAGETDLFRYRAFGNGNLHLTFKDLDLLARFNQAAGGARLGKKGKAA